MRIVFMGTPDFSVPTLEALYRGGHAVVAVVTQPDKPKGRGKAVLMTPVKEKALALSIPVYQPDRVKTPEFIEILRELAPDAIVVTAFGQILPKEILELPRYGCVNVHASLLPKYRGAAPIQWAVIDGERVSGVTTMLMDEGLDTGDMLEKAEITLDPKETGGSLFEKLSRLGGELILSTLDKLEKGTAARTKQRAAASYAKMLKKSMGEIDWTMDAARIERLVRGLNPWPSAYTYLDGKTLKLWAADVLPEEAESDTGSNPAAAGENQNLAAVKETREQAAQAHAPQAGPAKIPGRVMAGKDRLYVETGNGILSVSELQLEGKKRMDAAAFLRGYAVKTGTILGARTNAS